MSFTRMSNVNKINNLVKIYLQFSRIFNPGIKNDMIEIGNGYLYSLIAFNQLVNRRVIVVPSDTVYGFACLPARQCMSDIYKIKERETQKPFAVCVGDIKDIYKLCEVTVPYELLSDLLPGPVTVCLSKKSSKDNDTSSRKTIAIRIPDYPFLRQICRLLKLSGECHGQILLTSANISGKPSCISAEEIVHILKSDSISYAMTIFNGGTLGSGVDRSGSTIVDLTNAKYYKILRSGCVEKETIKKLRYHGLMEC